MRDRPPTFYLVGAGVCWTFLAACFLTQHQWLLGGLAGATAIANWVGLYLRMRRKWRW